MQLIYLRVTDSLFQAMIQKLGKHPHHKINLRSPLNHRLEELHLKCPYGYLGAMNDGVGLFLPDSDITIPVRLSGRNTYDGIDFLQGRHIPNGIKTELRYEYKTRHH